MTTSASRYLADQEQRFTSGLILPLPELAAFTARWRATSYAHDQPDLTIERRFPPHVTVLVPWADPDDAEALTRLRAAVAHWAPMTLTFGEADMFQTDVAGTAIVWLRPEPDAELRAMVREVLAAFPEYPPYEGLHPDPTPHLTVSADGDVRVLAQVRRALAEQGPLTGRVDRIGIYARGEDLVWNEVDAVPLLGHAA